MILKKQVRLYLLVLPSAQRWLCPAQSTEQVKTFLAEEQSEEQSAAETEIFYLGWTEMERTEAGYNVSNFQAQENSEQLTGKEVSHYPFAAENRPPLSAAIIEFLENYYREERLERLETELNALKAELSALQKSFLEGEK